MGKLEDSEKAKLKTKATNMVDQEVSSGDSDMYQVGYLLLLSDDLNFFFFLFFSITINQAHSIIMTHDYCIS